MDMERVVRVLRVMTLVIASVLLAACGAEDNGEEETPETSDAQPTVEVTQEAEEATGTPPVIAAESPTASDVDETVPESATPTVPAATDVGTPPSATPEPDAVLTPPEMDDVATPDGAGGATPEMDLGTDATGSDEIEGDGTTGATTDLASTPVATDVATPASGSTPAATPESSAAEPLSVSSCDVENVPPFTGEPSTYVVAVDVNFRVGPGTDCELAFGEPIGEFQVVEVIGGPVIREDDGSEWVQIEVLDTQGWVAFEFLEPAGE